MTDQSVNPFDVISPVDHSVPETGPSGRPIVRTEEGIVTEGSKVIWDRKSILWALPQPLLVAGSVLLVAAMVVNEWGGEYYRVWTLFVAVSATPFYLSPSVSGQRSNPGYSNRMNWRKTCSGWLRVDYFGDPLFPTCIAHPFLRDSSPSATCLRCRLSSSQAQYSAL